MDEKYMIQEEEGIRYSLIKSRYNDEGLLSINPNFAMDYYFKGDPMVWLLHPDGTRELAETRHQILEHKKRDGEFGILREDWERVSYSVDETYDIYQIKEGGDFRNVRFLNYQELTQKDRKPDMNDYEHVYHGQLERDTFLNDLYEQFNINHPDDYRGRSMSISDIIAVDRNRRMRLYYVDRCGFVDVTDEVYSKEQLRDSKLLGNNKLPGKKHYDLER